MHVAIIRQSPSAEHYGGGGGLWCVNTVGVVLGRVGGWVISVIMA